MTIDWPRASPMYCAWMRTDTSTPPPAANGTTSVIGRFGQSWAWVAWVSASEKTAAVAMRIEVIGSSRVDFRKHGTSDQGDEAAALAPPLPAAESERVQFVALPPAEQPLDIGELELHVGGAAVVALAGIGRCFHLAQQRVHLLRLELAAGAHRAVARHGGGDMQEPALERQGLVPFGHVVGEIAHQRGGVDLAEQRRRLGHRHGARAARLDHHAAAAKRP